MGQSEVPAATTIFLFLFEKFVPPTLLLPTTHGHLLPPFFVLSSTEMSAYKTLPFFFSTKRSEVLAHLAKNFFFPSLF